MLLVPCPPDLPADLVEELANSATDMDPEVRQVHTRLEGLRHRLEAAAARDTHSLAELEAIQARVLAAS